MDYEIVYSKRRTISLCIKDGGLVVKAPIGTPKKKIGEIVSSHTDWIEKNIKKQSAKNAKISALTDSDIATLKKIAKQVIPVKVERYAKIMGLNYGRITITSAKTRFGSCSSKGNLSFSYLLMLYPEPAIDYVVVHELSHLKEMNHSPRFYRIVASVLPDYKERQKLLKQ